MVLTNKQSEEEKSGEVADTQRREEAAESH